MQPRQCVRILQKVLTGKHLPNGSINKNVAATKVNAFIVNIANAMSGASTYE